jgi:hypothetical protein
MLFTTLMIHVRWQKFTIFAIRPKMSQNIDGKNGHNTTPKFHTINGWFQTNPHYFFRHLLEIGATPPPGTILPQVQVSS